MRIYINWGNFTAALWLSRERYDEREIFCSCVLWIILKNQSNISPHFPKDFLMKHKSLKWCYKFFTLNLFHSWFHNFAVSEKEVRHLCKFINIWFNLKNSKNCPSEKGCQKKIWIHSFLCEYSKNYRWYKKNNTSRIIFFKQ